MITSKSLCMLVILANILLFCKFTTGRNIFEIIKKAEERQQKYLEKWNNLVENGEIIKDMIPFNGKDFEIYKFVGEQVRGMKVKEIFYMLQNWNYIVAEREFPKRQRFIEMNIGGEPYQFRIALDRFGHKQIVVYNANGHASTYNTLFTKLDLNGENAKQIAELMLESARSPLKGQPIWRKKLDLDDNTFNIMREFMIVTQVAEAARPTGESFMELVKVMDKATELQATEEKNWNEKMKEFLNDHKSEIRNSLTEEEYNNLRSKILSPEELLVVARKLKLSKRREQKFAREEFLRHLPEQLPEKFKSALLISAEDVVRKSVKEWLVKVNGYGPKNGRIPGSDKVAREILRLIVEEGRNLVVTFEKYFPISKATQKGRQSLYVSEIDNVSDDDVSDDDVGDDSDSNDDGPSRKRPRPDDDSNDNERPRKKGRFGPKLTAVGDGDKSGAEEALNKHFKGDTQGCKNRRKRAEACTLERSKVVDGSFKWEENTLSFETVNEDGRKTRHVVEIDLTKMSAREYTNEHLSNLEESGHGLFSNTGQAVGVYGAAVGILASIQYFSQDEYGKGAFSAIQAAHGIGGLTGLNDVIAKVTKQAIRRSVTYSAEKLGLEEPLERLSEATVEALGESTSKALSRFAGDVPFVGLSFDLYFISEDIKDLADKDSSTPEALKIIHLVLDVDTTVLTLIEIAQPELEPFIEPFVISLTVIRISIDYFYLDIQDELEKVKGQGFGAQLEAFSKGFVEGVADFFTLGLVQQIKELQAQQNLDRELLRNISNPASYFNVTFQGIGENGTIVGTVDFTAGILSQLGGFLSVKLNENGSFTVELPEVPTESGIPTQVVKTFSFPQPVNDIVLGVGEVANPHYIRKDAKLWFFIPVESFDVIESFEAHQSSKYGVYQGNSNDNNFYAVQNGQSKKRKRSIGHKRIVKQDDCPALGEFTMYLNSYHYDLYGNGGDDRFFLGPQTSRVAGGDDNDLYYIHANGGRAIINNFAHDEEMDTLFLNVSYQDVWCERQEWDLVVGYCQANTHSVKIRNWFVNGNEGFYRHIYLATADGVVIEVTKSELNRNHYSVSCNAVSIDKSSSTSGEMLTLAGRLSEVKQVTGSNYSDVIIANEKPNILNGGLGNDHITGGNGSDIYLINRGGGQDTINNFAEDQKEDTIVFGISYVNISVEKSQSDLIVFDSNNQDSIKLTLSSWFEGQEWQHAVFVSSDYVRFIVKEDEEDEVVIKQPLSIDLSEYQFGVKLNLQNSSDNEDISVNKDIADEVKVIMDSKYNDTIIGNTLGNFLTCTKGSDYLQGNSAKDTYIINEMCNSVTINNFDKNLDFDMILLNCSSGNIHLNHIASTDLLIECNEHFSVHLQNWFLSPEYRHLIVKTSNKIAALLPENITELNLSEGNLIPYQIETDENCGGELRIVNLTSIHFSKCERFIAKTDTCIYSVIGNHLNNYIDPGPGNSYGHQTLQGNNGTDTYVMGHRYGTFNTINNFAEDKELDHLKFDVVFHDTEVFHVQNDAVLTSRSMNDSVMVNISNYYKGAAYQHLLVHSIDGVLYQLSGEFPYIDVFMVDFSSSKFSQVISALENSTFSSARILLGSKVAENYIEGGENTTRIMGGQLNDTIIGGPGGEDLIGFSGDDYIFGGPGNDALYGGEGDDFLNGGSENDFIYGGKGADAIVGGPGINTIVFSGYNFTGVTVDLQIGLGWDADAEGDSYKEISNILASEYDDFLVGNDDDNVIRGYGGDDFIVPAGGDDLLQGGTGSDIYQLDNAFGHKVINNFATDEKLDLIIMNKTSSESICYYFYGEDLQINIAFDNPNSTDTVRRITVDENFLMITLPFWLRNTTYQHIVLSFSDKLLLPEDFENATQVGPMIDLVRSGLLLKTITIEGSDLLLNLNASAFDFIAIPETLSFIMSILNIIQPITLFLIYHLLKLSKSVTSQLE